MRIDYLFSRNNKIGSKIIAFGAKFENLELNEIPSHMAILINEMWVFESTLFAGVRIIPYRQWLLVNEELYKIPFKDPVDGDVVKETIAKLWGSSYDWMGLLFFTWRYLGLILINKPLPTKNRWENKNKYFCTEFAAKLVGEDYSMKSPAKICTELIKVS